MRLFLACACILAGSIAACSGSDEEDLNTDVGPEVAANWESVEDQDLSVMVLPLDAYAARYSPFVISEDSGFNDNAEAAEDSLDPNDTAPDFESTGYVNGYDLSFEDPHPTNPSGDVFSIGSSVELYRDAAGAKAIFEKQVSDFERFRGQSLVSGTTLAESSTWPIEGAGDEAIGIKIRVEFGESALYGFLAVMRADRLVGAVGISSVVDDDRSQEVESYLRALSDRMQGVMSDEIMDEPVPIPTPEDPGGQTPFAAPYPDRMVLTLEDLPPGATIDEEGYQLEDRAEFEYKRDFDLGTSLLGNSEVASVMTGVRLYSTEADASTEIILTRQLIAEGSSDLFAGVLASKLGGDSSDVSMEDIPPPAIGDEAAATRITFETDVGTFEATTYYVREGRALLVLLALGVPGKVNTADVEQIARLFADRAAAELAASES